MSEGTLTLHREGASEAPSYTVWITSETTFHTRCLTDGAEATYILGMKGLPSDDQLRAGTETVIAFARDMEVPEA